jgi:hypothetical protein
MGITTRTSLLSALRTLQTARCPFRLPFGSSSLAFWSSLSHLRSGPQSCTIRNLSSLNQKPLPEHEDFSVIQVGGGSGTNSSIFEITTISSTLLNFSVSPLKAWDQKAVHQ